jgi:tRNA-2-methylthio-N6-dimethylallyladenosine synthase
VTTIVTGAAPHHLIADGEVITHRRTRAGDASSSGQHPSGVVLGMPGVGQPGATAEPSGCAR